MIAQKQREMEEAIEQRLAGRTAGGSSPATPATPATPTPSSGPKKMTMAEKLRAKRLAKGAGNRQRKMIYLIYTVFYTYKSMCT